jgi:hypothetical protein
LVWYALDGEARRFLGGKLVLGGTPMKIPQALRGHAHLGMVLCMLPAAYCVVIVAYALFKFSDFASSPAHFLRYVAGPLAIAGWLAWIALRGSKEKALMIGINAVAILAALFAHETYATFKLAKSVKQAVDTANTATQAEGLHASASLPPGATLRQFNRTMSDEPNLTQAVLAGPPHRDVLMCFNPLTGPVRYRADRYGFNNPDNIYDAGPIDVALFGDSFTEGQCLEPGDDVAGQLRAAGVRTASFGMRGNGPLLELAALGRYGPAVSPKAAVVLYFAGNDWTNLEREIMHDDWLLQSLDDDADFGAPQWSEAQSASVDAAIAELWRTTGVASSDGYRRRILRNYFALVQTWSVLGLHYPTVPKQQPIFKDIVKKMKTLTNEWGGDLILVYIPRQGRFRGALPNDFVFDADRRLVAAAAREADVRFLDLAEEFSARADGRIFYGPDGHFSEAGAKLAASLIANEVEGPMRAAGSASANANR